MSEVPRNIEYSGICKSCSRSRRLLSSGLCDKCKIKAPMEERPVMLIKAFNARLARDRQNRIDFVKHEKYLERRKRWRTMRIFLLAGVLIAIGYMYFKGLMA